MHTYTYSRRTGLNAPMATAIVIVGSLILSVLPAKAQDDEAARVDQPAIATVAEADIGRPHFEDGAIYWRDARLSELCTEMDGLFVKMRASGVFACHLKSQRFPAS